MAQPVAPGRKSKRRGWWIALGVVVLLGCCCCGGVDRLAAGAAEGAVRKTIVAEAQRQGVRSSKEPSVSVEGYPFLTQAISGTYDGVKVTWTDVTAEGLKLSRLWVHATGIDAQLSDLAKRETGNAKADRVTGEATLTYDSIVSTMGRDDVKLSEDGGRLKVTVTVMPGLTTSGYAEVSVTNGVVRLKVTGLSEKVPAEYRERAAAAERDVSREVPVPELPYSLTIDGVNVASDGLTVRASARDVPLRRP